MQRSKVESYFHYVWATRHRTPLLTADIEREVFGCIREQVTALRCQTCALNGMPDHVHLVVQLHSTVALARLAQAVKGTSSQMANATLGFGGVFDWQDHYGAFSLSRSHVERAMNYVDRQKQRHARQNVWSDWEETEMEFKPE